MKVQFYNMIYLKTKFLREFLKKLFFRRNPTVYKIKFGIGSGLLMLREKDELPAAFILGTYEVEIKSYFKRFASQCNYFLDIGASDGYYSLIYRRYNKYGKIFICDANPVFRSIQEDNFKLNKFLLDKNISQVVKFISDKNDLDNIRVDDLISEKKVKIFFKIDVEGSELNVLRGGVCTLKDNQCYLIVETHSLEQEKECIKFLKSLKYICKIIEFTFWRIFLPEERYSEHNRWFIAERKWLN